MRSLPINEISVGSTSYRRHPASGRYYTGATYSLEDSLHLYDILFMQGVKTIREVYQGRNTVTSSENVMITVQNGNICIMDLSLIHI